MNIDMLIERVKPALDEFRKDPSSNPNYLTMMRLRDRIVAEHNASPIFHSSYRAVEQAGTKVRLVMVSRFGDVGITDKMDSVNYIARVGNERNPGDLETWFNNIEGLANAR